MCNKYEADERRKKPREISLVDITSLNDVPCNAVEDDDAQTTEQIERDAEKKIQTIYST